MLSFFQRHSVPQTLATIARVTGITFPRRFATRALPLATENVCAMLCDLPQFDLLEKRGDASTDQITLYFAYKRGASVRTLSVTIRDER